MEAITKENLKNPAEESEEKKILSADKKIACQKIEKLLKKYSLETKDLPAEYQNWTEQIQKLESSQAIAQLAQQIKEVIAKKNQMLDYQTNNTLSSSGNNNQQLFWLGLGIISLSLGGLIILLISSLNQKKNVKN